jgi:uncharacterized membrane protein YdbT with pleckstrin-like domain
MASYEKSSAALAEATTHRAHLHWIGYAPAFIVGVIAIIARSLPAFAYLLFACAAYLFIQHAIRQWCTEILVTNRRVVYKTGLISRNTIEVTAQKIEGVEVEQSILGRLLNYGTLSIRGTGIGTMKLTSVIAPLALRRALTVL